MNNKFYIITISLLLNATPYLYGDIILLKDGTIYLGDIKSVSEKGIVIETLGTTKTFNQKSIQKSSKNIGDIQGITAEVRLKNGSVMKGTIQNYSNDVGLLLKTDYGSLTMPANGIVSIHDSSQKKRHLGPRAVLGVTGGCYFPVGAFKNSFKLQPLFSVFTEINSGFLQGLYFGVDAGYMFMRYRPDRDVHFDSGTLKVYAQYRFLDLRILDSPARILSPFISAGCGFAYIARRDHRPYTLGTTRKNEIDAVYTAALGIDFFATDSLIIRVQGSWLAIQQDPKLLNAFSANIGLMWGF